MKKIMNILLGVLMAITIALLGYALATGGSNEAISLNLIWGYALFALAIFSAVFCATFGMIKNPAGLKGTVLSLALIVIVVGAAYFYSNSHVIEIPNLADGNFFGATETIVTETSILVTYVAFVAAFISAIVTEVWSALK